MKFLIEATVKEGSDPIEMADAILNVLCATEDVEVDESGLESFDSCDPVGEVGRG